MNGNSIENFLSSVSQEKNISTEELKNAFTESVKSNVQIEPKKRGRKKKEDTEEQNEETKQETPKKKGGRKKKEEVKEEPKEEVKEEQKETPKKKGGRKKKEETEVKPVKKTKTEQVKNDTEKLANFVKREPMLKISRNSFGNYEHRETKLVFDPSTKEVIGIQEPDGRISELTVEDIQMCREYRFDYRIPETVKRREKEVEGLDDCDEECEDNCEEDEDCEEEEYEESE